MRNTPEDIKEWLLEVIADLDLGTQREIIVRCDPLIATGHLRGDITMVLIRHWPEHAEKMVDLYR